MKMRWLCRLCTLSCLLDAAPLLADITQDQVLVVYNSASAEGTTLADTYLAAHPGIPLANVVDLNDAALLVADITQADFISRVRDPIRAYLSAPGLPGPSDIISMVLIRPMPHRILDSDDALVGDAPNNAVNELLAGDATYASLDAELVLLWQDLFSGEAGGTMDSLSDNLIDNPYHQDPTPIDAFDRTDITTARAFTNESDIVWVLTTGLNKLTPGDMYLVCRIDGNSLAEAEALIDRSLVIDLDKPNVRILFDEYDLSTGADLDDDPLFSLNDPFLAGDDLEETRDLLLADGWDVRYDDTFDFITGAEETSTLIAYTSYGENHSLSGLGENPPGVGTYIEDFVFAAGAYFHSFESYNARALNGLATRFNQEQCADFLASGGTFAVGAVFEPFTFTAPDQEWILGGLMVRNMCFAEAAYSGLPALSWQAIVFGDPLGRYILPIDCDGDFQTTLADFRVVQNCFSQPGVPAGCECVDVDHDGAIDDQEAAFFAIDLTGPMTP